MDSDRSRLCYSETKEGRDIEKKASFLSGQEEIKEMSSDPIQEATQPSDHGGQTIQELVSGLGRSLIWRAHESLLSLTRSFLYGPLGCRRLSAQAATLRWFDVHCRARGFKCG